MLPEWSAPAMQMVVFLFVYGTALIGTVVLVPGIPVYLIVAASDRRHRRGVLVPLAMIGGLIGGILFIWSMVPRAWSLPLWETFAASVNAKKYGHPVEHYAQLTVILMLFGGVVGAVVGGLIVAWLLKQRPKVAARHAV